MAAGIVAFSSLASRLLGIFRDRILAGEFGAGATLDVYYAAFRIPDFIYNLLILGALSAGFIPVFTALWKKGNAENFSNPSLPRGIDEAWWFVSNVVNVIALFLIAVSLAGSFFAPAVIRWITPGFSPENRVLTVELTRIMFLSPLFLGLSGVVGGVLQSAKRFFIYSLSPIFYNAGIIIGALYFTPLFGPAGLAWGVVFGALLHLLVQLPSLYALGFRYDFAVSWRDANLRQIARLMVPRTMSLATSQINLLVITVIASTLAEGSLAVFNFANNLQAFAVGIFGISFAIAAFPTLSDHAADTKKLIGTFSRTARQILFFIIPSSVILYGLRAQIVRVVLGAGKFDWPATLLTMEVLSFFSLSLFAQAVIPLLTRVYYARHDSRRPFFIGLASDGLNVVLSLVLAGRLGVGGLALAFSISNIAYLLILWAVLRQKIGRLDEPKILLAVGKSVLAAFAAAGIIQAMKKFIWPLIDMATFAGVLTQGLSAGLAGIAAYLFVSYVLQSEEFFYFADGLKRRMQWRKVETGDSGEARGI